MRASSPACGSAQISEKPVTIKQEASRRTICDRHHLSSPLPSTIPRIFHIQLQIYYSQTWRDCPMHFAILKIGTTDGAITARPRQNRAALEGTSPREPSDLTSCAGIQPSGRITAPLDRSRACPAAVPPKVAEGRWPRLREEPQRKGVITSKYSGKRETRNEKQETREQGQAPA
jgi:hypothetical protein